MCSQLKEEFAYIVPDGKSLVAELQPLKSKILKLAEASAAAAPILQQLPDGCSEGSDFSVNP